MSEFIPTIDQFSQPTCLNVNYKLVLSGTIGAGKSSILQSIVQYLRIIGYKVGCVREFIDSYPEGGKKLSDWITGKISLVQFQDFITCCHLMENDKIIQCPIKVYERTPYESAQIFCLNTYCYRHVLDQANELHTEYKIPYPFKENCKVVDANGTLTDVFEAVREIVEDDLAHGVQERVIYLRINLETCIERIKARGRLSELAYSEGYLANLIDAYEDLFQISETKEEK